MQEHQLSGLVGLRSVAHPVIYITPVGMATLHFFLWNVLFFWPHFLVLLGTFLVQFTLSRLSGVKRWPGSDVNPLRPIGALACPTPIGPGYLRSVLSSPLLIGSPSQLATLTFVPG
ncbi:unnamed protein product [Protopolystoma xenopodis]|uniref:Uncharacterized protein n=1 Tax=Protopolystoma xenopodis TaxID=117903 RepID=A0A3S5BQN1_9PLAT|nr:unnamed protein product [Protopolystoma xenopodis]